MPLFRKSESDFRPQTTEAISDGRFFVRRNIVQKERTDANGQTVVFYAYEEAVMSPAEYAAFVAVSECESKRESAIIDEYTLTLIEQGVI